MNRVEISDRAQFEQSSGTGWVEIDAEDLQDEQEEYAINTGVVLGDEGTYAVYGQYLTLVPGKYQVTFTLELLRAEGTTERLGVCDVGANGGKVVSECVLSENDFSNGAEQQITLQFQTENQDMTDVEFRLYVEPGVQFRVTDISYQCVSLERQAMLPESEDYQLLRGVLDRGHGCVAGADYSGGWSGTAAVLQPIAGGAGGYGARSFDCETQRARPGPGGAADAG